jgi:signal transduction histidine kinase
VFAGRTIQLLAPEHDINVVADEVRVRLLLKNLLDNALRHTPAGSPPPELTLEQRDHVAELTITDHGTGIEPQHLPHLSEPFYRADAARLRETGGYGLGLYLCRVIAEAHGGTLHIDSQPGQGTQVRVSLPN